MNAIEYFGTVAEIAITLAGFSGLVMAFKSGSALTPEDLRRVTYILVLSFAVLVTALLPAALSDLGFSPDASIRSACLLLAFVMLGLGGNGVLAWKNAAISPHFPRGTAVSLAAAIVTALVLFLSSANIILQPSAGLLLLSQLAVLLIAGWIFLSTIIWTRAQNEN